MYYSGIADEAGQPIETQIKAHKELGWKHIEIRSVNGVNLTDLCDRSFEEVVENVTEAGLAVSCFASQLCNWARPISKHPDIDRHELARAIPRMRRLGCRYIRTMSYPNAGWPQEEWKEEVIGRMKELARMAEDGGVVLVHENCDGWAGQGPEQSLELLERVNSSALKLLWDTGNPIPHAQEPWLFYDAIKEHIVYVHVKDGVSEGEGGVTYTFCGEGEGKVREVIADLIRRGYDGPLSIEPHMAAVIHEGREATDEGAAYRTYVQYGRKLMALVEQVRRGAAVQGQ